MILSKVKSCQEAGDWSNEHGIFYKFEYIMEDGKTLTASHKKQEGFPIGSSVDYEIKGTNEHGSYGSVKKPETSDYTASKGGSSSDAVQLMIVRQSSLHRAVEVCIHNRSVMLDNSTTGGKMIDETEIIELAEMFTKWVMKPEVKAEPTPQPQPVQTSPNPIPQAPMPTSEDMSF
ncbi:MAG: hypothetical protein JKY53_15100 [Flavobacteriales bacterium]|nr:hypothetical protein [Flavobacteriales bacterium]